jgi:YegS/Rv2252/BmrU family lipid kinase
MPKQDVKLIINPNADLGRTWRMAADLRPIVEEFGGADWAGTAYPTHATELARQAAEDGYRLLIAAGGDGTVHEIINGLMLVDSGKRPQLGIVPLGSGNDFAYNAGVEFQSDTALRNIFTNQARKIDLARIEDDTGRSEYFCNVLGIGFDAKTNIHARSVPIVRGFLMYFIAVLKTITLSHEAPRMTITTDGESWEDETLMITLCNGAREGGGFSVAPQAVVDDGWLDYVTIRNVSRPMMLRLVPEVMNGKHGRFSQVRLGKFRQLKLESEKEIVIHIDGEVYAGFSSKVRNLSINIIPAALELIT